MSLSIVVKRALSRPSRARGLKPIVQGAGGENGLYRVHHGRVD